jgi:hypothetical protein
MPAYFVSLDSSVLIEVLKEIWAGKEPRVWGEFKRLIESKVAALLVPQVTLLELEKHFRTWSDELGQATAALEAHAPNDDDLSELLRGWRNKKRQQHWAAVVKLRRWLETGTLIDYTPQIAHRTKHRLIAGNYPANRRAKGQSKNIEEQERLTKGDEWLRDQDCAIIESLIWYFNGGEQIDNSLEIVDPKDSNQILVFATNDKGFGPINEAGIGSLDDTFRRGLPSTQVFKNLGGLVKFVTNQQNVTPLTKGEAEEIELNEQLDELFDLAVERGIFRLKKPHPALQPGLFDPIHLVQLLKKGSTEEAGVVSILKTPVTSPNDYNLRPHNVLTFEQVQELSKQVGSATAGTIDEFDWR